MTQIFGHVYGSLTFDFSLSERDREPIDAVAYHGPMDLYISLTEEKSKKDLM